jgi:hypothetical protein
VVVLLLLLTALLIVLASPPPAHFLPVYSGSGVRWWGCWLPLLALLLLSADKGSAYLNLVCCFVVLSLLLLLLGDVAGR